MTYIIFDHTLVLRAGVAGREASLDRPGLLSRERQEC